MKSNKHIQVDTKAKLTSAEKKNIPLLLKVFSGRGKRNQHFKEKICTKELRRKMGDITLPIVGIPLKLNPERARLHFRIRTARSGAVPLLTLNIVQFGGFA